LLADAAAVAADAGAAGYTLRLGDGEAARGRGESGLHGEHVEGCHGFGTVWNVLVGRGRSHVWVGVARECTVRFVATGGRCRDDVVAT